MKTRPLRRRRSNAGYTLTEIMITTTIFGMVVAGTLTVFMMGMRSMYRDIERLSTDSTLRRLTLHVAKETIDSTEFYVFPNYQSLDGSVNLVTDISPLSPAEPDEGETQLASGDCLVLVTRVTIESTSNVRQFRIYYRPVTSAGAQAPLRYYESTDYGSVGSEDSLNALLNAVNLKTTPAYPGSRELASITRGKPIPSSTDHFPVFSTEATVPTATNESVSLNIEVINGKSAVNMLSSSSFNYTISPRR
jgi:prepilin-type N-terminal cleavage/methylation domain-containing protein